MLVFTNEWKLGREEEAVDNQQLLKNIENGLG